MVNLGGFGLAAAINGGIAFVILSLFCWARQSPLNRFVYAPRTLHPAFRQGRPPPPPPSASFFGWIADVIRVPRATFIATAGLDAYIYIRWMELCTLLFAGMTVLGVGVLVPVNYTAMGGYDGFDAVSMSNLPSNSVRLTAHLIVSYIFAAWTYFLLYRMWVEYADLRLGFMAREQLSNRGLTLLVQDIPEDARSDASFLRTFRSFFPLPADGSKASAPLSPTSRALLEDSDARSVSAVPHFIHSAYVAKDVGDAPQYIADRDDALNSLEHSVLQYQEKPDERPMAATRLFCLAKKDALEHYESLMHEKDAQLAEARTAARDVGAAGRSNGFITFDTAVAYRSAATVDATSQPFTWTCQPAPEMRDVYWPALAYTSTRRLLMGVLVGCMLAALVLLWTIPVIFVQSIANLQSLATGFSVAFSWIDDIPSGVLDIIDGFLPGLVLTIFNILLPMMLYKLSKMQGIVAWSWLQASVVSKFTIFQIVNNFFFSTAATAILGDLQAVVNDPSGVVDTLAQNIPKTGTFFITYLLFTTLSVYPLALLNPGGLIVGRLKKRFLMKTPRDVIAIEQAPARDYGTSYPITLFTFIIAISYSVLASLALPFAVLYFAFGYVVNKSALHGTSLAAPLRPHSAAALCSPARAFPPPRVLRRCCGRYNHLYVYNTHFETGGQLWPVLFKNATWCIFIAQAVFTLLLGLSKAPAPAVISAPLVVFPWLFYYFVRRAFLRRTVLLPLDAAVALDAERDRRRVKGLRGSHSTAFLDDNNALQEPDYDVDDIRARRDVDVVYPHNTCTQKRTEAYHTEVYRAQHGGKAAFAKPPPDDGKDGNDDVDAGAEDGLIRREAASVSQGSASRGSVDGRVRGPPQHSRTASSSLSGEASVASLRSMLVPRSSSALLAATLQSAEGLGPLPLPLDYVQPELVAPEQLPVPRSIGGVQPLDSVERSPQLFDELSMAALERHASKTAAGQTKGAPDKDASATAPTSRADSPDDPVEVRVHR